MLHVLLLHCKIENIFISASKASHKQVIAKIFIKHKSFLKIFVFTLNNSDVYTYIQTKNELSKNSVSVQISISVETATGSRHLSVLRALTGDSNCFLVSGVDEGFLAVVVIRFQDQVSLLLCLGWRLHLGLVAKRKCLLALI